MRLNSGSSFCLFNGRDGEFLGEIVNVKENRILVRINKKIDEQIPDPDIWLLFSPIKKNLIRLIVEKATELGVAKLLPVLTDHTNFGKVNLDRLKTHAIEAAEQCQRMTVPEISEPLALSRILETWDPVRRLLVMDETNASVRDGSNTGVKMSALRLEEQKTLRDAILVGPEGGFSQAEHNLLARQGFVKRITLGQRLLRTETAALVSLALWNELIDIEK